MNWTLAIDRNRGALLRLVAMLFAMVGLTSEQPVAALPPPVRFAVLRLLRPAESALRRLIVIAARGVSAASARQRRAPLVPIPRGTAGNHIPAFRLFDPRKRFARRARYAGTNLRLSLPGIDDPVFVIEQSRANSVSATRLCRRLQSLRRALENLPSQARRLVRLTARADGTWRRLSPMRPGSPPGHRKRAIHEVDTILTECDELARWVFAGQARPP